MAESKEELLGELVVSAKLAMGRENLRLLFTDRRIIFDHMGKRGWGAIPGTNILGGLSASLENLFKSGRESVSKRTTETIGPERILASHKDNFAVAYEEVINVTLTQTETVPEIILLTTSDKLELSSRTRLDRIAELFKHKLGDRLIIRRRA